MEEIRKSGEKGLPGRTLLYSIITLVILGLVAVNIGINLIWLESFVRDLREIGINYLLSEAKRSAENIEKFIQAEINDIKRLSQDVTISENTEFFISRFLKENPAIKEISIINLNGKEEKRYSRREYFIEKELRDFAFLEEFEKAKEGQIFISKVDFTPEGEPYIKITAPIRKLEIETPRAVLQAIFYLEGAWEKVLEMKIGETGRVSVIDDKGMLIADPDPSRVLKKINLLILPSAKAVISGEIFRGTKYLNEKGIEVFGVGVPIKILKWGVIIEQTTEELESSIKEVQKLTIIFLVVGAIIVGVLVWLDLILRKADKEVLKRHRIIENQSKKLEETKTSLEIRTQARTRELQELAQKLEEQIRERTKELQNKVGELEKFNRLAVGRELKMIELKEEITKLKEQLQNQKPSHPPNFGGGRR